MVHPVDRGNQVEGYASGTWKSTAQGYPTNATGDYPSGQAFVDPASNVPNDFASWKGRLRPRAARRSGAARREPGEHRDLLRDDAREHGLLGLPAGLLGLREERRLGYSLHFAKRSDLTTVCVNFYDVHGGGKFNSGKFHS
jgi:hypothetical protein